MKKFKASVKSSCGTPIGDYIVEIDTDDPVGEGDILTLEEEMED